MVMHWSNGCRMNWAVNQERTIGKGTILRWKKIKMVQDGRHLNEHTEFCHTPVEKSR